MTNITITINANVQNISIYDIFYILNKNEINAITPEAFLVKFMDHEFKLETEVNETSINYTITELR
jgi:hypothetical protein